MADEKKKTSKKSTTQSGKSLSDDAKLSDLTIKDLSALLNSEVERVISDKLRPGGGTHGVHVNSGPPGFVNGGGHANFDPGDLTGSHVNSGPPGFVNGGGHANFDPSSGSGAHVNSGPPGFVNGGGHANFDPGDLTGSHVNSGPPGFVNGGGHANFDPDSSFRPDTRITPSTMRVTLKDGTVLQIEAGLGEKGINLNIKGR